MSKNTIIFFICVFFHYKKKIRVFIEYIKFFFNEIIVLNYFLNLVFGLKKNIFKSKELNIFLNKNMSFWKNKKYKISKQNKSILVENFVNQPAYTMSNAIISQYLKKIYNYNIIGLLRDGDYIGEAIFKSYEINEIYYYKDLSLIQRLKSISISLKLIKNSYKIEDF